MAQANLDDANASLDVAKLNLERSTVVAPVNGIVTNFDLLPGRYVNAGARSLCADRFAIRSVSKAISRKPSFAASMSAKTPPSS